MHKPPPLFAHLIAQAPPQVTQWEQADWLSRPFRRWATRLLTFLF